jgi:glycosyltransferase involved in cell wall biosynthesis
VPRRNEAKGKTNSGTAEMKNKIYIVIAAYNEEKSIANVLDSLLKGGYNNIILVDDGSSDKTSAVAITRGVAVLRHVINRGQGAALKTGIDYAVSTGADIIVTFDADGQHQVKDIKAITAPVFKGEVEVTLGSRFIAGGKTNISPLRKLYLKIGTIVLFFLYGVKLTDSQNGLRAFSRKAAQKIELKSDKMEHASEIIEQIHKKKLSYKEIPVEIKYTEYSVKHGQNYIVNAFNIFFRMIFKKLMG